MIKKKKAAFHWVVQPTHLISIFSGCHINFYSPPPLSHLVLSISCTVNILIGSASNCSQLHVWIDIIEVCVNAYQQTVREYRPCGSVIVISMSLANEFWQRGKNAGAKSAWSFIWKGNWATASQEGYDPAGHLMCRTGTVRALESGRSWMKCLRVGGWGKSARKGGTQGLNSQILLHKLQKHLSPY